MAKQNRKHLKGVLIGSIIAVAVIIAGFVMPLGTYTTTVHCSTGSAPQQVRLHAIAGQSLGKQRAANDAIANNPAAGCPVNTTYTLYLF